VEPSWDKAKLIEDVENRGLFGSICMEIITKDMFLVFEAAKAMPFFKELDLSDQVNLDECIGLRRRYLKNFRYFIWERCKFERSYNSIVISLDLEYLLNTCIY
jgi:hypothetical protein